MDGSVSGSMDDQLHDWVVEIASAFHAMTVYITQMDYVVGVSSVCMCVHARRKRKRKSLRNNVLPPRERGMEMPKRWVDGWLHERLFAWLGCVWVSVGACMRSLHTSRTSILWWGYQVFVCVCMPEEKGNRTDKKKSR